MDVRCAKMDVHSCSSKQLGVQLSCATDSASGSRRLARSTGWSLCWDAAAIPIGSRLQAHGDRGLSSTVNPDLL
jgi:hypothetical protein